MTMQTKPHEADTRLICFALYFLLQNVLKRNFGLFEYV